MLFDDPNLLSNEEIRDDLIEEGYELRLIDSIIQQFWFHDWGNSFISNPKHFELLKKYLLEKKSSTFSRFEFYTFFYNNQVQNYQKFTLPLQRIALIFELMQTDNIDIESFQEILKGLGVSELISLGSLEESNLITIVEENNKEIVKWVHHTLTEYLAAIYILDQRNPNKSLNKYMCSSESGTVTFIPSWTGTLRFIVEKSPELVIDWLETGLKVNLDFLNDQVSEVIVFSTPTSIQEDYKRKLFHLVYDSYQDKKWWIPVWAYHKLYKFINRESYTNIKKNVNAEGYEYRGNIAAIIDGMLQNDHSLITADEKNFWRNILINYANEITPKGVLQRHSLAALENFVGDSSIIKAVAVNDESNDNLVKEAFLNMCKAVDPNAPISIKFFIKGISEDTSHIYARNALYAISTKDGVTFFLQNIVQNQKFIHEFLDKESIFNKDEKQADKPLLDNIQKNLDSQNIDSIKKLILNAFIGERNYKAGESYFLQQLALLIQSQEPNYLEELIETIQKLSTEEKNRLFINDFEGVLSVILEVRKLEKLKEIFNDTLHHHSGYTLAEAIRLAPKNGNPKGEEILRKGIELGITADPEKLPKYDDHVKERELEIYKQFRQYLSPPVKDRYFPEVFRFFIDNQKIIEKQLDDSELQRLLNLALDSNFNKIDPVKINIHYKDSESKTGEYTISSVASYFGDVLRVIEKLKPETFKSSENRKKVINFIPFAYSNDLQIIKDILVTVNDEEITTLNTIMMDKENDARYLIPQTYIYFSSIFTNLKSPKEVLISFIKDKLISESDKDYALKTLQKYILKDDTEVEKLLLNLWNPKERNSLSTSANDVLISVFHNNEAISWRFQQIKDTAKPFKRHEGAHSVGELELEIDYNAFANPLIELKDEKYLKQFIDLLDFSLSLNTNEDYSEYMNYIWRIAIAFVIREDFFLSEEAYEKLKKWAEDNKNAPNINWFHKRLEMALNASKSIHSKQNKVSEAITLLNHD